VSEKEENMNNDQKSHLVWLSLLPIFIFLSLHFETCFPAHDDNYEHCNPNGFQLEKLGAWGAK
jgi:hypothetical protein